MAASKNPIALLFTSLRGRLVLIFIAVTFGGVTVSTGYTRYLQNKFTLARAQELAAVDLRLISSEIQTVLHWVIKDIFVLRDLPQLAQHISTTPAELNPSVLASVQKSFQVIAEHHKIYHQVRYIDDSGMEVVRINYDGRRTQLVPRSHLQNKKHRYYFKTTIGLQKGQIYISPLDLNIEHGKIETPHVPAIRYATPVVDQNGKTRGIIVVNVLGTSLLNIIDRQQKQLKHHGKQYFLINSQSFFLFHPQPEKTFGFMFKNDERLENYEPQLMDAIVRRNHGSLVMQSKMTGDKTLFAYHRIPLWTGPLDHFRYSLDSLTIKPTADMLIDPNKANWTLIAAQNEADLFAGLDDYTTPFLLFTLFLLVGCILMSIFVGLFVSSPVVSLASAALKIQSGDLSARAKIYSQDEMGRFGRLFNTMAAQLETSVDRLKASEIKYRTIFENSRDCFFVVDADYRIVDLNRTGAELLGLTAERDEGSAIAFPWAGDADDGHQNFHHVLTDEGFVKNRRVKIRLTDGTIRECLMTATTRRGPLGEFKGFEGTLRDITERRKRARAKRKFQKQLREEIILAEERERRNLGQILHEELAQNLALAHLKIQGIKADLTTKDKTIEMALESTRTLLGQMIRQIRAMVFDLYPAMIDTIGLIPAMERYAQNFSKQTDIPVTIYDLQIRSRLTKSQEVYLFRAYKELLHNVLKHAKAQEIVVTLVEKNEHLRLVVDDDGRGFNTRDILESSQHFTGIGLISIREWIMSMDGRFSVESGEAKGTRVMIEIPVGNGETDD